MTIIDTPGAVTIGPPAALPRPVPLTMPEPDPVTGPTPTTAERRAAQERLALASDRDVAAAVTLAHRLGRVAEADPFLARTVTAVLDLAVDQATAVHGPCTTVGCVPCLYLTDAAAVAQAWKDGPS